MKWVSIIMLMASTALANGSNKLMIGVSFNMSEGASVDLSSMKPWVHMNVDKVYPDKINKFRAGENHHGYLGLALIGSGLLIKNKLIVVVGEILVIDDVIQHSLRIKTPVHMISDELYKNDWYRNMVDKF